MPLQKNLPFVVCYLFRSGQLVQGKAMEERRQLLITPSLPFFQLIHFSFLVFSMNSSLILSLILASHGQNLSVISRSLFNSFMYTGDLAVAGYLASGQYC